MTKKKVHIIIGIILLVLALAAAAAGTFYWLVFTPQFHPAEKSFVYIDRDDTADSVFHKVELVGKPAHTWGYQWMADYQDYASNIHTGRYAILPEDDAYHLLSRLLRGYQEPLNVTVPSVRTFDRLAGSLGRQLMIDSVEVAQILADSTLIHRMGYDKTSLPCLIVPDTYEMYWNITPEALMERLQKEHDAYWDSQRKSRAQAIGLTPEEVVTLASIVEEETANDGEKPMVAGLYMNRLHKKMLLQADPTVKFALQDAGRRRILNSDLKVDSPYNTYLYTGLPPGPIRVPSKIGIEADEEHADSQIHKQQFSKLQEFSDVEDAEKLLPERAAL